MLLLHFFLILNCKSINFLHCLFFMKCFSFAFLLLPKIFPTVPKSQSKPEGPVQRKPNKATISIFEDDEEEVSVSRSSFKIWNKKECLLPNTRPII